MSEFQNVMLMAGIGLALIQVKNRFAVWELTMQSTYLRIYGAALLRCIFSAFLFGLLAACQVEPQLPAPNQEQAVLSAEAALVKVEQGYQRVRKQLMWESYPSEKRREELQLNEQIGLLQQRLQEIKEAPENDFEAAERKFYDALKEFEQLLEARLQYERQ